MTTLTEMFIDQDARTFEERRAEVVAIARSATDFAGTDEGLRSIFRALSDAQDEQEFDEAYDELVVCMSESTTQALRDASSGHSEQPHGTSGTDRLRSHRTRAGAMSGVLAG